LTKKYLIKLAGFNTILYDFLIIW